MNKFTQPGRLKYVKGSITAPENAGLRLVLNVCSESGKFESATGLTLAKRWPKVKEDYKNWFVTQQEFKLGNIHSTAVASDIWIIDLLCEDKTGKINAVALGTALKKVAATAKYEKATVHLDKVSSETVQGLNDLLVSNLIEDGINVNIYE